MPAGVHGTTSTASSVSLAWDPSAASRGSVSGYRVYVGGTLAASVSQPSATVGGLAPGTSYSFTVAAYGPGGSQSARSAALALTTPVAGGPASYEAESSANTIGGGAGIASCPACSGGEKVGYIGGTGYLIFNGVTAPRAGTYLMQVSYVDGDSGRPGVVTVDGTPFNLPLPGTNDNNWAAVQTATVPVQLNAGANTIEFGNPDANVYDVDKIAV
jgi:hypothetical protein